MKSIFTLLLLFVGTVCFAQTASLRIEPSNVTKEVVVDNFEDGYQDITNITVTNTGDKAVDLVPEQFAGKKPGRWNYGTFSRRNDATPFIVPRTAEEATKPVRIGPGESAQFAVVLNCGGQTGLGTVGVIFKDANVPGVNLGTANFTTRVSRKAETASTTGASSSTSVPKLRRPAPSRVNLYPNPARERFFVEVPGGVKVGRVDISNTVGKRVLRYDRPAGTTGYDIKDLPDGMYLISIFDDRGKRLKTLRLIHRRFGA
ncbi:T9SS type A sorting domain-containing protein [Lewinella sp. 4G2]|uniref:T9SS type A sorting domain-containing protein n=1 Tax=Lewinella sp. 4G2 TaxID=1803372 RepID=UPI0007B4DB57|nr:T9SS type A sorting domain-containing protein [Lewinella sp. 4G2]OAV42851.1 hypothetical protein A3850_016620 [Lewinella sp. 4G2]